MMAEQTARRAEEIEALRTGLDLGLTLIDPAEMYGDGAAEELVAEAVGDRRDEIFLVSKVLPEHASGRGTVAACEASLRRLGTDRLDLYLLHWRGGIPLEETLDGLERLTRAGKIRRWGVSNFDVEDMEELTAIPGGEACAVNQVLYNLTRRGIEAGLMPWCRQRGIPLMAYSPVEQGRLLGHPALNAIAQRLAATPAQVALSWLLAHPDVCAIPKAGSPGHVVENADALGLRLEQQDVAALDAAFPPPTRRVPLDML
jgi:diketogulonate reductase-like aldo/keto reductase